MHAIAAGLLVGAAPADRAPMELTLRPVVANGEVNAIAVTIVLPRGPADKLRLSAAIVYPGASGVADRLAAVKLADGAGAVPLVRSDDAPVPGGFPYHRHWAATRAVHYPARLTYRALVQPPGGAGGPAFGIRAVGGGVTGSGATFLLLPDRADAQPVRVHWT